MTLSSIPTSVSWSEDSKKILLTDEGGVTEVTAPTSNPSTTTFELDESSNDASEIISLTE